MKKDQRITEKMLFQILDLIHEAIHITDENGVMIYANHSAELLEHTPKSQIIGGNAEKVYPYMDYENGAPSPSITVLRTGIPRIDENCEYFSADGQSIHSIVSNYPYSETTNGKVSAVLSVSENIDEMKKRLVDIGGVNRRHIYKVQKKMMRNGTTFVFDDIVGESRAIKNAIAMAKRFAAKKMPIMIYGETGTGKEMFAQSIHNASPVMNQNFVPVNCAAIPENLLESMLFGTVKGAFTGAVDSVGLFEKASQGTIFLDEINSMPMMLQAKILRAIQEKEIRRIGENKTRPISCRIISATNKQPLEAIRSGELREDLFYRLSTGLVFIPPLRERSGDIPLLCRHFLEQCNVDYEASVFQISDELLTVFRRYPWQGNIRELANTIESAISMVLPGDSVLTIQHLPPFLWERFEDQGYQPQTDRLLPAANNQEDTSLKTAMDEYERMLIEKSLKKNHGNIAQTSRELGITRQWLDKKIKKHGLIIHAYRQTT